VPEKVNIESEIAATVNCDLLWRFHSVDCVSLLSFRSTQAAHLRTCFANHHSSARMDADFADLPNLASPQLGARIVFATDEWFAAAGRHWGLDLTCWFGTQCTTPCPNLPPQYSLVHTHSLQLDNLIADTAPVWDEDAYTPFGKWMDGWESRRRRTEGHDWCIVKLGLPCIIKAIEVRGGCIVAVSHRRIASRGYYCLPPALTLLSPWPPVPRFTHLFISGPYDYLPLRSVGHGLLYWKLLPQDQHPGGQCQWYNL
jgi:hypothetical protein